MYQKVQLIGRLGADPDIRFLPDGTQVAGLRIATDESYKNQAGDKVQRTEWHRVVLFSRLAEVAGDYAKKGRLVMVEGKLRTRKWTDEHKIDRYTTEVVGNNLRLLDKSSSPEKPEAETAGPEAEPVSMDEENVPF